MKRRFEQSDFYQKHKYRLLRANDLLSFFSALCLILFIAGDQSNIALQRAALSNEIKATAILTGIESGVFGIDKKVIRAMAQVPRHRYISMPFTGLAYYNVALPVKGHNYMTPEPFITAMMVHLLDLDKSDTVLDIGFDSGYDAAVMAQLAKKVYAVRQTDPLDAPGPNARALGRYDNIVLHDNVGDRLGWPEAGPYDAILVRQSMTAPPVTLLRQLKPGGRLVIPIGMPGSVQHLTVYTLDAGGLKSRQTLRVKMAPLFKGTEI